MSDAKRPTDPEQETLIRGKNDFYGNGNEPSSRGTLADRLMGRAGGPKGSGGAGQSSGAAQNGRGPQSASGQSGSGQSGRGPGQPASTESGSVTPTASSQARTSNSAPEERPVQSASTSDAGRRSAARTEPEAPAGSPSFDRPARPGVAQTGAAVSAVPAPTRTDTPTSSTPPRPVEPEPGATSRRDTLAADDSTASKMSAVLKGKPNTTRRTRKARLRLASVDPWSVMKMAFLFSMAVGIATIVAVAVVWFVIGQSGLFDSINKMVNDVFSQPGDTTPFDLSQYLSAGRIIGSTVLLAVIDVVLVTALATVGAFLYNTGATLLGGVEVTLADD